MTGEKMTKPDAAPTLTARQIHDKAKTRAVSDLVDLHRAEYFLLKQAHIDQLRAESGWYDRRKEW